MRYTGAALRSRPWQGRFGTAIWATKRSASFGDKNIAQMPRRPNGQKCLHTPSALNAEAKRSGATCHMAMPQCCYLVESEATELYDRYAKRFK